MNTVSLSDWLFDIDVDRAIQSIKSGKAAGADGVSAEHLKFSQVLSVI